MVHFCLMICFEYFHADSKALSTATNLLVTVNRKGQVELRGMYHMFLTVIMKSIE